MVATWLVAPDTCTPIVTIDRVWDFIATAADQPSVATLPEQNVSMYGQLQEDGVVALGLFDHSIVQTSNLYHRENNP